MGLTIKTVGAGQRHTKITVYGKSGVGKTKFVGSCGARTLILRPPTDHTESIFGEPVEECVIQDWGMMEEMKDYLRTKEAWDKYEWVWLDSISLWEEIGLDDIWEVTVKRTPARAQFGRDKGEYGINMQRMEEWLRAIVGLDKFNFGVTALPMLVTDPENGEDQWMPLMQGTSGKRSHLLCGYMNIVAYLGISGSGEKTRRVLYTQHDGEHYAKDQYTAIKGGKLINPTMPKVMQAVQVARDAAAANNKSARSRRAPRARRRVA